MEIGFTGTQVGMTAQQKEIVYKILKSFNIKFVHIGDCIGSDNDFYEIAFQLNIKTIGHIPNIDTKRVFRKYDEERIPKPYLQRNWDIVNESDLLIATPKELEEQLRSGTWATIRNARKTGLASIIIFPNGTWNAYNFKNLWRLNS